MPRSAWRPELIQRFFGWRDRRANTALAVDSAGTVGSPDLHQAKMRFLVLVGCVAYGVWIGVFDGGLTRSQAFIFSLDAVLFGLFALYTHRFFKLDPKPDYSLRAIGLFADHGAALACLAVTGRDAGALAWLPLFIVQGVGIRFGVRWLHASQAIGVGSVGIICTVNPFFRENVTVALGAILSVLVLPLYFALLAKREARVKSALQQARLDAEEANAAKGRFVAMISHELRTPLTGISGLNELLRQQDLPDYTRSLLTEQGAATALMLEMVNDVLDLSKVEEGAARVQEEDFDPQKLAHNVLQGLAFQARRKGLGLYTELDASLPASVRGSPFHVSRILQNLLGNAIKFTPVGSVTLRVKRDDSPVEPGILAVRFEVVDTGIGIPDASLPRIYERFYQVDAAITRQFGGTGLGTSLVKEFCDLLGGSVRIESELGEGTHCQVVLPFKLTPASNNVADLSVSNAEINVCVDGIAGWPQIKDQLIDSGKSIVEVAAGNDAGARAGGCTPIVLLSGYPSHRTRNDLAAMGLASPTYIALQDFDSTRLFAIGSAGVAIRARPDATSICRAVELALLGSHFGRKVEPDLPTYEEPRRSGQVPPAALTVLLAEDSPAVQLVMRATLENAGFIVDVANDGADALSNALRVRYDVIVLDWNMPKLDGIEVLRRLRSTSGLNEKTSVVIATAAPSEQLIEEATAAGAWSVLGKPFIGAAFVRTVTTAAQGGVRRPPISTATPAKTHPHKDVTEILDLEVLEAPGSIFRTGDHAKLIEAFTRDVQDKKVLLKQALQTADLPLFRSCIHSLTGYAGVFGARRLEWLLAKAPRDEGSLKSDGPRLVTDLCASMSSTALALDEWSRSFLCSAQ